MNSVLCSRETALMRLGEFTTAKVNKTEGPVVVGSYSDAGLKETLLQSASHYLRAFNEDYNCLSLHEGGAVNANKAFYTTQLQAGLGLVDETKLLLSLYQRDLSTNQLYKKALDSGLFPMVSARRLRNIIVGVFCA